MIKKECAQRWEAFLDDKLVPRKKKLGNNLMGCSTIYCQGTLRRSISCWDEHSSGSYLCLPCRKDQIQPGTQSVALNQPLPHAQNAGSKEKRPFLLFPSPPPFANKVSLDRRESAIVPFLSTPQISMRGRKPFHYLNVPIVRQQMRGNLISSVQFIKADKIRKEKQSESAQRVNI